MRRFCSLLFYSYHLPSPTAGTHRSNHRVDIDIGTLSARVGDVAGVVAVPVGAAANGAAVFHGITLSCLELRVGEEHDHAVAPATATAASKVRALVGADDRAVRLEHLYGIPRLRVDFQRGLGADILRGVAGTAARADAGAARDLELVVVAVEAFLGRA